MASQRDVVPIIAATFAAPVKMLDRLGIVLHAIWKADARLNAAVAAAATLLVTKDGAQLGTVTALAHFRR
ncbi:hypothetical protein [Mesorhizobium sp. WSM2239]|uniref:Uncharacterized protein n=2 Tax=unclassified Mesorhizobium TaxID=325217 RepID=A0AAU8DJY7_9HYPH